MKRFNTRYVGLSQDWVGDGLNLYTRENFGGQTRVTYSFQWLWWWSLSLWEDIWRQRRKICSDLKGVHIFRLQHKMRASLTFNQGLIMQHSLQLLQVLLPVFKILLTLVVGAGFFGWYNKQSVRLSLQVALHGLSTSTTGTLVTRFAFLLARGQLTLG